MSDDYEAFVRENRDHLRVLDDGLVELERSPDDREVIDELFRAAHTLKGNCDMAGLAAGRDIAHAIEDALDAIRAGAVPPREEVIDAALDATEALATVFGQAAETGSVDLDPTPVVTALRDALDEHAADESEDDGGDAGEVDLGLDDLEPDEGISAEEALDSVSGLDDLDSLVEDMGDELDEFADLDGGGAFDSPERSDATGAGGTPEAADNGVQNEGWLEFRELQETDSDRDADLEELEAELDEVQFGEFDDEDDMSIQDILDEAGTDESAAADHGADDRSIRDVIDEVGEAFDDGAAADSGEVAAGIDDVADVAGSGDDSAFVWVDEGDAGGAAATASPASTEPEADVDDGAATDVGIDDAAPPDAGGDAVPPGADSPVGSGTDTAAAASGSVLTGEATATATAAVDDDLPSELSDVGLEEGGPASTGFTPDTDTEEFEARFRELFEGEADRVDVIGEHVATLVDHEALGIPAEEAERNADAWEWSGVETLSVDIENAETLLNLTEELGVAQAEFEAVADDLDGAIDDPLARLEEALSELRATVVDIRLLPLETVMGGLPRVVRNAAADQGKDVEFTVVGEDVALDRNIVDALRDPLVHLVRNAVAHGIEPPEEREERGKPPTGSIEVRATRVGGHVEIEIEDDGRGIDPDEIRATAIENGMVTRAEADTLSRTEIYDLVFESGLSTAAEVSEVSGRGVGMNVVKDAVEANDGTVEIESEPGMGTIVRLVFPVTTAVTEVLFVESGEERYGIPMRVVEEIEEFAGAESEDGREVVPGPWTAEAAADGGADAPAAADEELEAGAERGVGTETSADAGSGGEDRRPLVRLADEFDTPGPHADDGVVVYVRDDIRPVAIHCDEIRDVHEVVVQLYKEDLTGITGISGAARRGDAIVHIIDVESL